MIGRLYFTHALLGCGHRDARRGVRKVAVRTEHRSQRGTEMPNRDRILLVEDDLDNLAILFAVLTHAGYSVLTAEDGGKAVDLLEHGLTPRAIILDLLMPRGTGWEVLKHLREDAELRQTPVLVITALSDADVRAVGADVVLLKPINHRHLLSELKRLIGPTPTGPN